MNGWSKKTLTRMIKNKLFKQGIGIAEKSQETRRNCWGGNVNHKSLFLTPLKCLRITESKYEFVVYIITPAIPSCFLAPSLAFFNNPYSLF